MWYFADFNILIRKIILNKFQFQPRSVLKLFLFLWAISVSVFLLSLFLLKKSVPQLNPLPKQWFKNPLAVTTKRAYRELIMHKFAAPTSQENIIDQGIKPELLTKLYLLPYLSTRESKLTAFQLKIIHNILPTNTVLYKMNIKDSEKCPYCAHEKQSMPHLFIECALAYTFWKMFKTWWNIKPNKKYIFRQHKSFMGFYNQVKMEIWSTIY